MKAIKSAYITGIIALTILACMALSRYMAIKDYQTQLLHVCKTGQEFTIAKNPDIYSCYNVTTSEPRL